MRILTLLPHALLCAAAIAAPKPNFIVISIDDLGYADIGPFGSKVNAGYATAVVGKWHLGEPPIPRSPGPAFAPHAHQPENFWQ